MKNNRLAASLCEVGRILGARTYFAAIFTCLIAASLPSVRAANLVQNGSLEDLNNDFVNTSGNYMSLAANSTAIADWTVSAATTNEIVWAKTPTTDGFSAANGTFFIDLTGFGSDSPNGSIQQSLQNLITGQQYTFSLDVDVVGSLPLVTVGGDTVALSASTPFTVGTTRWTPETGIFTAGATSPLLKITNQKPGQQIDFIDNVIVTGATGAVPEPASIALLGVALAALCLRVRRPEMLSETAEIPLAVDAGNERAGFVLGNRI